MNDQVPILRHALTESEQAQLSQENLLVDKILPYIVMGEATVSAIAEQSGVELEIVKMVI